MFARQEILRKERELDRDKYLKLCQLASYKTRGFSQLTEKWNDDELVRYDGVDYIPMEYAMKFHYDGKIIHTAILRGVNKNFCIHVPLDKVEKKEIKNETDYSNR